PLHRPKLPEPPNCVFDLEIDLWTVKRGFTFHAFVLNPTRIEALGQGTFCLFPVLGSSQVHFARVASLYRQFKLDLVESECLQHLMSKVHTIVNFARNLLGSTKQVRVIDRKTTNAH